MSPNWLIANRLIVSLYSVVNELHMSHDSRRSCDDRIVIYFCCPPKSHLNACENVYLCVAQKRLFQFPFLIILKLIMLFDNRHKRIQHQVKSTINNDDRRSNGK